MRDPGVLTAPDRGARRADRGLVVALQLATPALLAAWLLAGNPLTPDGGLQQVDVLTLAERVPGVAAHAERPTLVVATGDLAVDDCRAQVDRVLDLRDRPAGLDRAYGLVLLVPGADPGLDPGGRDVEVRPDPGGALARALALPRAAQGCEPGYAVTDADGVVRYRSYDPGWGAHSLEQEVLLAAAARGERHGAPGGHAGDGAHG